MRLVALRRFVGIQLVELNVSGPLLIRRIHTIIFSPYFFPALLFCLLFLFPLFISSLPFKIFLYILVRDVPPSGDIFHLFLRGSDG